MPDSSSQRALASAYPTEFIALAKELEQMPERRPQEVLAETQPKVLLSLAQQLGEMPNPLAERLLVEKDSEGYFALCKNLGAMPDWGAQHILAQTYTNSSRLITLARELKQIPDSSTAELLAEFHGDDYIALMQDFGQVPPIQAQRLLSLSHAEKLAELYKVEHVGLPRNKDVLDRLSENPVAAGILFEATLKKQAIWEAIPEDEREGYPPLMTLMQNEIYIQAMYVRKMPIPKLAHNYHPQAAWVKGHQMFLTPPALAAALETKRVMSLSPRYDAEGKMIKGTDAARNAYLRMMSPPLTGEDQALFANLKATVLPEALAQYNVAYGNKPLTPETLQERHEALWGYVHAGIAEAEGLTEGQKQQFLDMFDSIAPRQREGMIITHHKAPDKFDAEKFKNRLQTLYQTHQRGVMAEKLGEHGAIAAANLSHLLAADGIDAPAEFVRHYVAQTTGQTFPDLGAFKSSAHYQQNIHNAGINLPHELKTTPEMRRFMMTHAGKDGLQLGRVLQNWDKIGQHYGWSPKSETPHPALQKNGFEAAEKYLHTLRFGEVLPHCEPFADAAARYMAPQADDDAFGHRYNALQAQYLKGVRLKALQSLENTGLALPEVQKQATLDDGRNVEIAFLEKTDPLTLFSGADLGNCMHPEGVGRECAHYAQAQPDSGILAVRDTQTGKLLGASWVWTKVVWDKEIRAPKRIAVLDSVEVSARTSGDNYQQIGDLLIESSKTMAGKESIAEVYVGAGYAGGSYRPQDLEFSESPIGRPDGYIGYFEAGNVARIAEEKDVILPKKQTPLPLDTQAAYVADMEQKAYSNTAMHLMAKQSVSNWEGLKRHCQGEPHVMLLKDEDAEKPKGYGLLADRGNYVYLMDIAVVNPKTGVKERWGFVDSAGQKTEKTEADLTPTEFATYNAEIQAANEVNMKELNQMMRTLAAVAGERPVRAHAREKTSAHLVDYLAARGYATVENTGATELGGEKFREVELRLTPKLLNQIDQHWQKEDPSPKATQTPEHAPEQHELV